MSYDETGIKELVSQMVDLGPANGVAGGNPWSGTAVGGQLSLRRPLPTWLVVNPRQVRAFAVATGTAGQDRRSDAAVLAHFADAIRPEVRPLRDAESQVLNSLLPAGTRC